MGIHIVFSVLALVIEGPTIYEAGDTLGVTLRAERPVDLPAPIDGELVLGTPDGRELHERVTLTNPPDACVGCDPVPGGGPNQCRNRCEKQLFSSVELRPFDRGPNGERRVVLDRKGTYRIRFAAPGVTAPSLRIEVTSARIDELIAPDAVKSFRLQSRSKTQGGVGGQHEWISWEGYQGIYEAGTRRAVVTVIDAGSPDKARQWAGKLDPELAQRGARTTIEQQPLVALTTGTSFRAIWPSQGFVVMVALPVGADGRALLDAYLGEFPSSYLTRP